jgi:hypothetical protein
MAFERWVDQSQPQTLQFATWLLYANAVLGLLLGSIFFTLGFLLGFAALVACVLAGIGIANERRWAYALGVGVAALEVLLWVVGAGGIQELLGPVLIPFLFAVALIALLLHPQSRDYQRIWFK